MARVCNSRYWSIQFVPMLVVLVSAEFVQIFLKTRTHGPFGVMTGTSAAVQVDGVHGPWVTWCSFPQG